MQSLKTENKLKQNKLTMYQVVSINHTEKKIISSEFGA